MSVSKTLLLPQTINIYSFDKTSVKSHPNRNGIGYVSLIFGMAIALVATLSLTSGLVQSLRISQMIKIQTQLWDMAQDEMEKIRNAPFEDLESSEIEKTDVFGQIQVELMNPRRKRVTVLLRHKQALSQPVVVATLVHKQGLRR